MFFCIPPAKAQSPTKDQATRVVLADGVRLILKPEADSERVAVSLFVRNPLDAISNQAAVGEMVARTLFYGNANRTQNSIQALIGEVGGSLDVLHTTELVAINYVTQPAQLPEALHLLCDCLKYASFAPESLARALQSIHKERNAARETNFAHGYAELQHLLGQREPEEDSLRRVTQEQCQEYFRRHYVPTCTVLSIAGRFDAVRIQGLLGAFLADYNRPAPLSRNRAEPSLANPPEELSVSLRSTGTSAHALVGTAAPSAASPDHPAFTVLQAIFGGGHASRLFQQARESFGVGYEVGALYPVERASLLVIYLQWDPQRASGTELNRIAPETITHLLDQELDAAIANSPTEAELTRARNVAIGQDALRHERTRDRAFLLGWYEALGLGYTYDTQFPQRLAQVTQEDVQRVARTYLRRRARVLVLPATK